MKDLEYSTALIEEQQEALYWHARQVAALEDQITALRIYVFGLGALAAVLGGAIVAIVAVF